MGWGKRAAVAALMIGLTGSVTGSAEATLPPPVSRVTPLIHKDKFADPSVVSYAGGYVAVSTGYLGPRAVSKSPRGPWHPVRRALVKLPRWVKSEQIWAPDLVQQDN